MHQSKDYLNKTDGKFNLFLTEIQINLKNINKLIMYDKDKPLETSHTIVWGWIEHTHKKNSIHLISLPTESVFFVARLIQERNKKNKSYFTLIKKCPPIYYIQEKKGLNIFFCIKHLVHTISMLSISVLYKSIDFYNYCKRQLKIM